MVSPADVRAAHRHAGGFGHCPDSEVRKPWLHTLIRTSESKGHWQLYDSSVALDLTFLPMTRGNAGRNVKSATLVPQRRGACLRQRIDAAFDAAEPAVHIAQQYLGCIRDDRLDLGCAPR